MEDTAQKKQRRSRKDMNQRNHLCKYCGKGYLSNAALYTHVKNKHESKKSKISEKGENSAAQVSEKDNEVCQKNPSIKDQGQMLGEKALEDLKNLLKKFFNERNKIGTLQQIIEGLNEDELRIFKPILIYWEGAGTPTDKQSICINYVIGYFIHLMSKKVSAVSIQFLIKFFYNFRQGLIYETRKNSICEKESAYQLPNYFNQIIMNGHITQAHNACQVMSNSDLAKRVIEHFGNWIYDEKFTDFKTKPNY